MKKYQKDSLLNKYYKGETTLGEEADLKAEILKMGDSTEESDIFGYYEDESKVPDNLEQEIFSEIIKKNKKRKDLRIRLYSITSAAAAIIIVLSIFLDFRSNKFQEAEKQFLVMEQAMYRVSESFQSEEQEEMFVLWVDDNVEIIIN